ncbi:hypothetical protein KKF34_00960 [Myxococcota bacterium]|nr:hypothetical protein [Myxococcota bacterium]MBU1381052.1 hypothetical protein [Myxococcota bacterium]MBU1495431.1 hypothetical protein [Myxococcota bacterium]
MPAVTIEVKYHYSEEEIDTVISSVHKAMMDVLKIPARDRNIRPLAE